MVNLDLKLLVTEILCAGGGSYTCWQGMSKIYDNKKVDFL